MLIIISDKFKIYYYFNFFNSLYFNLFFISLLKVYYLFNFIYLVSCYQ